MRSKVFVKTGLTRELLDLLVLRKVDFTRNRD